jgi:hypothetical protein
MDSSETSGKNRGSLRSAEPAGFWIRLAACLADCLILGVGALLLYAIKVRPLAIEALVGTGYFTLFICSRWQATPGGRLFNIYVVRAGDGRRLQPGRSFCRFLVSSWPALLLAIIVAIFPTSRPGLSALERAQYEAADAKFHQHHLLNADEAAAISRPFTVTLSEPDSVRFNAAAAKLFAGQPLAPEEEEFYHDVQISSYAKQAPTTLLLNIIAIYSLVIAYSVGQAPEKTGLHDTLCKTRALRGRPGSS